MTPASPRALQAIVFDFDGVLADTEPLHLRAFQQTLAAHGLALEAGEYYERYLGFDDAGVFRALGQDRELAWDERDVARLVAAKGIWFREVIETTPVLFDGVRASLRAWAHDVPFGIASGALRSEIELILQAAGVLQLFPVIVAAGETPAGKPEPDPYLAAVAKLGVPASGAVAIEDSIWGIESARAAGLKVVAVTTSYPRERLTSADAVVDRFEDLTLTLFDELAAR